ncbi:PAX3- and PAX7-binding protein 1 [Geodia barretti]|nr:PAX3- and PAX7-binding protein 1 [Geodia barretti]
MEGGGSGDESEEEEEEGTGPLVSLSQQLKEGCFIPNAEFIHRARREREERRQMGDGGGGGGAPGFMALSTSKKKVPVAKGKSRLVREDDNDKSDESGGEDGGRRRMDAGSHDMAAVKQFQVLQGLEEMGSDEDEETKRWEEEQILKGVKASAPDQLTPVNPGSSHLSMLDQSFLMGTGGYGDLGASYMTPSYVQAVQAYAGITPQGVASETPPTGGSGEVKTTKNSFRIPEKLVPITLESLKSRLSNRLCDLQDSVSGHRERLGQIIADLEGSREEVGVAESRRGDLGVRYQFYQEMRGYLRDLLSCLGEKEPQISSLERAVRKVRKERADLLLERRRQDITDQDRECAQTNSVVQVPGSQEVVARQRRAVERDGRRRRRRERRERGVGREKGEHRQGMSTDDELLEMNRLKFEKNMTKALAGAESVFGEVVEDFSQVVHIKTRLEEWKFGFPDSYSQAHVPLYLPQLLAPFARLELLQWNPLEDECPDFEAMQWFEVLMFYGFREGEEPDLSDPDTRLLPELVDRVIVTKLTILVQSVWDPLSSGQTRKLTSLLRQLASDYPTVSSEHRNTQSLFSSVLSRLRRATQDDVFIPLYTRAQIENSLSPHAVFYSQQFWSCVKLLGNITEWEGLVSPDALQELVLDGLLNKYLVLSLQTCPCSNLSVIKTGAIISRLPVTWLADGCHGNQTSPGGGHLPHSPGSGAAAGLHRPPRPPQTQDQGSGEGDIRAAGKTRSHFRIAVSLSLAQPPPSPLSPSRRHNSPLPSLQRHCLYTRSPFLSLHLL